MKNKKAQLTIFIIIALIIVVALLIIFFLWKEPIISEPSTIDPEAYIENCIRDSTKEAIAILLKQGGDIEPRGFILYQGKNITYLCHNANFYDPCINQRPMLIEHIEDEITDYVKPAVQSCFSSLKKELEKRNYVVSYENLDIDTELQTRSVFVTINTKFTLTKNEEIQTFEKFKGNVVSPIYDLAEIANEIASQEGKYCYFNVDGFNSNYRKFEIRKDMIENSKIYSVKELTTGKEFKFATRGCVMPTGL